jgi:hypothetical protein
MMWAIWSKTTSKIDVFKFSAAYHVLHNSDRICPNDPIKDVLTFLTNSPEAFISARLTHVFLEEGQDFAFLTSRCVSGHTVKERDTDDLGTPEH